MTTLFRYLMTPYSISRHYANYSWFYATRREYYEEFYEDHTTQQLVHTLGEVHTFDDTITTIEAFEIPFETSPRRLVQKFGFPRYHKATKENAGLTEATYFYRKNFYQSRVIVQFNFIDGELSYCIATFLNLHPTNEARLIDLMKEKYQVPNEPFTLNNRAIVDAQGNFLLYEKSIHARLIYVREPIKLISRFDAHERKQEIERQNMFQQHEAHWSNLI